MPQENVQADPVLLTHLLNETIDKRLDILRRVADVGSISEAARGAGVSYKAAWQAIETLSNLAGGPLVEKVVGGRSGGGTRITPCASTRRSCAPGAACWRNSAETAPKGFPRREDSF